MKKYLEYIITIADVALAGVFAILVKVWTGFMYFVLATLMVLALFWGAWLIYKFFTTYKEELNERFKIYKATTINATKITVEHFNENEATYRKDFSKKMRKEKFVKWFVIAFCFALAVAFLFGMIWL